MIKKTYEVGDPESVADNLIKTLDGFGRVHEELGLYGPSLVYLVNGFTVVLERHVPDPSEGRIGRLEATIATEDDEDALNRGVVMLLDQIRSLNPEYDLSQFNETR
jgi:hypothetical protein